VSSRAGRPCQFLELHHYDAGRDLALQSFSKNMSPKVSIVVPAYNEAGRLGKSLRTIFTYLNQSRDPSELIVVDDGSEDETAAVAEKSFADAGRVETRLIRYEKNRGKGYAARTGLLAAAANIALFSDADLSTPITEVPKLTDPIRNGECDLTFGSRALDRGLIGVHQPWRREQGGRVFNLIVRVATGLPFWDTQCGFKAFRMNVCRPLIEAAQIDRFGFDVELIYLSHLAQLRLREIAVRWDHSAGGPLDASGNYARDSLRMINEVRRIRRQVDRGVYSEAISASRTAAMVAQKQGRRAANIF
jgi:glycosyltransferase involved in cell wall biosynthesis